MWWYAYPGNRYDRFFARDRESSIAAGVRRIEAVTAEGAEQFVYAQQDLIRELRALMNHMPNLAQAMKKSLSRRTRR